MNALKVDVPDETLSMQIDTWEDGKEYLLTVRQIAPGSFTAVAAEPAVPEEEEMPGEEMPGEMMPREAERPPVPMRKSVPAANESNPAIALVIAAGKKKPKK